MPRNSELVFNIYFYNLANMFVTDSIRRIHCSGMIEKYGILNGYDNCLLILIEVYI